MTNLPPVPEPTEGNEHRIYGPPGTGKTTTLAAMITSTAQRRGRDTVMVASFTNSAAQEIGSRKTPLNRRQIGTLHSFAYRAIGSPGVAEEYLVEWNREHPSLALTVKPGQRQNLDEPPAEWTGATDGDVLMAAVDSLRAKMRPTELWGKAELGFHKRFTEWKRANGVVDFTDMIEDALVTTETAPGAPEVGFFDEAQDFTRLELHLVRHWGKNMDRVILAGDDDQMLYSFKGAQVDALLDPPLPDHQIRVLDQSYRVPRRVHAVAQHWVERLSRRAEKVYLPRDEEGEARYAPFRFAEPSGLIRDVTRQVDAGRTVMLLASCGYMLDPVKHGLRERGIPFHNPYRRTRGDWNPLRATRGTSSVDRLISYLISDERIFGEHSRLWTGEDFKRFAHVLKASEVFRRGAKSAIAALPDRELTFDEVADLFIDERNLEVGTEPNLDWFQRHLLAGNRKAMDFPINVVRHRGALELTDTPKVVIGTIHSVKGGQADVVYVCPELSRRAYEEWGTAGERRDSVIRLMYVAMTRAREEVVICQQNSHVCVDPALLMAGRTWKPDARR